MINWILGAVITGLLAWRNDWSTYQFWIGCCLYVIF